MISGKKIKRDTQILIISVLILTIVTLNVSYSAFFSVETQSNVQTLKAGVLDVTILLEPKQVGDLFPVDNDSLPTPTNPERKGNGKGKYTELTLTNNGSLNAEFSVTISYDNTATLPSNKTKDDFIDFKYLRIGIFDVYENTWVPFVGNNGVSYNISFESLMTTDESTSSNPIYPILRGKINTKTNDTENDDSGEPNSVLNSNNGVDGEKKYYIYIWLDQDTPTSEIDKLVYLKLDIKSTIIEETDVDQDNNQDNSQETNQENQETSQGSSQDTVLETNN